MSNERSAALASESLPAKGAAAPSFELTDQRGGTVSDRSFHGKTAAVFFGFTHCPGMCPLAMTALSSALEKLGDSAAKIAPVFISIDPERDTPARLTEFLEAYHPSFIGLTGEPAKVTALSQAYGVYAERVAGGDAQRYAMDHSGYIYVLDNEGRFKDLFSYDIGATEIARRLTDALK